jgi:uncharacterized membrane protein
MSSLLVTLTVLGILGSALVAGVFYAFSGFVRLCSRSTSRRCGRR